MLLLDRVQLLLQHLDLLGVLPQQGVLGILVYFRLIFDTLRPICVAQRA